MVLERHARAFQKGAKGSVIKSGLYECGRPTWPGDSFVCISKIFSFDAQRAWAFLLGALFFLQNFKNKRGSGQVMFSEKVNEGERIMFYIANVSSE